MLASAAGTGLAALGLAKGDDLEGTLPAAIPLTCPIAPRPILPLPNPPNALLDGLAFEPIGDEDELGFGTPARSLIDSFPRS